MLWAELGNVRGGRFPHSMDCATGDNGRSLQKPLLLTGRDMAQDYARLHDSFLQIHDLQPPPYIYNHLLQQATPVPTFKVNVSPAQDVSSSSCAETSPIPDTKYVDAKKRKPSFDDVSCSQCELSSQCACGSTEEAAPSSMSSQSSKKWRSPSYRGSAYEDDPKENRQSPSIDSNDPSHKKRNHSQIEKRRRDKMNTYISELCSLVPMCRAMMRKLDKLTVLRMAVQHLRSVRGALTASPTTTRPRPSIMSEIELNALVLQAAQDCFLFVVGCDRGRLFYVSSSVTNFLNYKQNELLGQSVFDIIHPKDIAKVKEQLSSSDISPRERLVDAKTMLPIKTDVVTDASHLCPGARRSFFCRIKCKQTSTETINLKDDANDLCKSRKKKQNERKYCVVHCTGYLKSWAPMDLVENSPNEAADGLEEADVCNLSCLVAVCRSLNDLTSLNKQTTGVSSSSSSVAAVNKTKYKKPIQYVSRHTTDGKFLFVDQRVTLALGYLPQELMGTSLYEYVNAEELGTIARAHKGALMRQRSLITSPYSFKKKDGSIVLIQTNFKPFKNPCTKDMECLVANNMVVDDYAAYNDQNQPAFDFLDENKVWTDPRLPLSETDMDMQCLIDSHVESHKIGSAIADEVLRRTTADSSPDLPSLSTQINPDNNYNYQLPSTDSMISSDLPKFSEVRNNVPLSVACSVSPVEDSTTMPEIESTTEDNQMSPPVPAVDGNGEAAMAVIMSLLEANAGFGGPMDPASLPWLFPETN